MTLCSGPNESCFSSLHVKSLMVDDKWLILGSTNWTKNSETNNHETSVLLAIKQEALAGYEKQLEGWRSCEILFSDEHATNGAASRKGRASLSSEPCQVPAADAALCKTSNPSKKQMDQFSIALGKHSS